MQYLSIEKVMEDSGVQFGTSGLRGLVTAMTDQVCWLYVTAFIQFLQQKKGFKKGQKIGVAGDLRSSTPRILNAVISAIRQAGATPVFYGFIPTPALSFYGFSHHIPTLMVTGSHIPDDRNGIKFNLSDSELLKADELAIRAQLVNLPQALFDASGQLLFPISLPPINPSATAFYIQRYLNFFPKNVLQGKHIGLYEHSSVASKILETILIGLGASVTCLGYSKAFISVDTEAIRQEDVALAQAWAKRYSFDAIISADGDGDRPLISDEKGEWIRGDIAGLLTAYYLEAETVITPISSNTALEKSAYFKRIERSKIGSPYVIEGMNKALMFGEKSVVGYEANGGFLLATPIHKSGAVLAPLPTRDAVIVPLAILMLSIQKSQVISEIVSALPPRYTMSDRLKNFPTERSKALIDSLSNPNMTETSQAIKSLFSEPSELVGVNHVDGLRLTFASGNIIHLRPSGNAPELRCYTESDTEEKARQLNRDCILALEARR